MKNSNTKGSFFDEIIDPLDAGRFDLFPPLGLFLPGFFADHEEDKVGKGFFGRRWFGGGRVGRTGRRDESLLEEQEVGVVLLGLLVAAVAWVRSEVQTVRKE